MLRGEEGGVKSVPPPPPKCLGSETQKIKTTISKTKQTRVNVIIIILGLRN